MAELTIAALCQVLTNITHNRCTFVENSNTCRCADAFMGAKPAAAVGSAPSIMTSEVCLIFFVVAIWLSAIGFCLHQYKSLRRLETQVSYCGNRKDPLNIGDIKIVEREQDSIIYKKKRYSTVLDTHINPEDLKAMHYVQEYLPKSATGSRKSSAGIAALVVSRDDLAGSVPLTVLAATPFYTPLSTHDELAEEQPTPANANGSQVDARMSIAHLTESGSVKTGLTVPRVPSSAGTRMSWNGSAADETNRSTQHLSVPSSSLRCNRHSDGNISFPVPETRQQPSENPDERLLDPRMISRTVRRSLLALHRESQENISVHRSKEKTQSENDVHGAFTSWKIKMKSKLKRTHHRHTPQTTPPLQSTTLSVQTSPDNSNEHRRRVSDYKTMKQEYRFSTPPLRYSSSTRSPSIRRSLMYFHKHSTQSTTESETTQGDSSLPTTLQIVSGDERAVRTIDEINGESSTMPM